jgi:hypothetical protein
LNLTSISSISSSYFFSYSSFDGFTNTIYNLSLYRYDQDYKFSEKILAKKAVFNEEGDWNLIDGLYLKNLQTKSFPTQEKFSVKKFCAI